MTWVPRLNRGMTNFFQKFVLVLGCVELKREETMKQILLVLLMVVVPVSAMGNACPAVLPGSCNHCSGRLRMPSGDNCAANQQRVRMVSGTTCPLGWRHRPIIDGPTPAYRSGSCNCNFTYGAADLTFN